MSGARSEQKPGGIREWYIVGWGNLGRKSVETMKKNRKTETGCEGVAEWKRDQKKPQTVTVCLCWISTSSLSES